MHVLQGTRIAEIEQSIFNIPVHIRGHYSKRPYSLYSIVYYSGNRVCSIFVHRIPSFMDVVSAILGVQVQRKWIFVYKFLFFKHNMVPLPIM